MKVRDLPMFIMCAGNGERMRPVLGDVPKQLLCVRDSDRETILGRTRRLLDRFDPCVVLRSSDTREFLLSGGRIRRVTGETLIGSIAEASGVFEPHLVAFLGDVVWSRELLGKFLDADYHNRPLVCERKGRSHATGRHWGERFAVAGPRDFFLQNTGMMSLKDVVAHGFSERFEVSDWDYTEDIDYPEELHTILPLLRQKIEEEDNRENQKP